MSKYLGALLYLSRLPRSCEQAIVDSVAARLPTWKAGLLTATGRTTLTQTTLSAILVHVSICCALSAWAIQAIDKRQRGFLWAGTDSAVGGKCKVAWQVVCSPRDLGGLGLPDLRVLGFALRLRWEWMRRTEPDSPWASLLVRDERMVQRMFHASVQFVVGNGASVRFWMDVWHPADPIYCFAPAVFRAVPARRRARSIRDAIADHQWARDASAASTTEFIAQFLTIWHMLSTVHLQPSVQDQLLWKWTANGHYSSASAYRAFFIGRTPFYGAKDVWAASTPPKAKFFFWLALHGRLWTAERRRCHRLQAVDDCALCDQQPETADHFLVACVFAREVWQRLLSAIGLDHLLPSGVSRLVGWWQDSRALLPQHLRRGFDSLVVLVSWTLWKERNARTFDNTSCTPTQTVAKVKEELNAWLAAGFRGLATFGALL